MYHVPITRNPDPASELPAERRCVESASFSNSVKIMRVGAMKQLRTGNDQSSCRVLRLKPTIIP